MKKIYFRMLALLLSVLCVLPTAAVWSFAESETGNKPTVGDVWSAVPEYASEMTDENSGLGFVRVPFVGAYTASTGDTAADMQGNCNQFLQAKHAPVEKGNAYMIDLSYRPHTNYLGDAYAEALFDVFSLTTGSGDRKENAGRELLFFKINLSNGELDLGTGAKRVAGTRGLQMNEWNSVRIIFYSANANYEVYVNGALYGYQYNPKLTVSTDRGEQGYYNCKDITVAADRFIPVKCNRLSSFTQTDDGEKTNYIDVRNVTFTKTRDVQVTLDGKERHFAKDFGLSLADSEKTLLYAEVKNPERPIYYTSDILLTELAEGAVINTCYMDIEGLAGVDSMRLEEPHGLRFLTLVNRADYEKLEADSHVKRISFGTVIFPAEKLKADVLTTEVLKDMQHLDVPIEDNAWYDGYSTNLSYVFAGTIADFKEKNYDTPFAGVGYVKMVMCDGSVVTAFSENTAKTMITKTLALAAQEALMRNAGLDDATEAALRKYTENSTVSLNGLNVVAMGDSLFQGAQNQDGKYQWINMLGRRYNWNLTNLGIGGASISYQPDKNIANASMYDLLFNHFDKYRFGSDDSDNVKYYTCGEPSGRCEDVDMVLLQAGSNDYGPKVQAPLGTIGSADHNTFLGAWKLVVERLLEVYPNATVVMMTAWENSNQAREDNANAIEYTSSVVDLYEALYKDHERVCLIDSGNPEVSGVDMRDAAWRSQYSHDSFHLNDDGMALMAEAMIPYLKEIAQEREAGKDGALTGIDVLAIGDSLFGGHSLEAGEQWLELLATRYDWTLTNLGVNGWTVAYNPGAYADPSKVRTSMYDKLMNDPNFKFGTTATSYYNYGSFAGKTAEDVDLIFLEGGWNDFGHGLPLGTAADTNGSTYMGAINTMVAKLLATYPNARVVLLTSWHRSDIRAKDGADRMDFVANGMKQVLAANYVDNDRVVLLDAGDPEVSGVYMSDAEWAAEYAMDVAHLNAEGMKVMAQSMSDLIWKLVP